MPAFTHHGYARRSCFAPHPCNSKKSYLTVRPVEHDYRIRRLVEATSAVDRPLFYESSFSHVPFLDPPEFVVDALSFSPGSFVFVLCFFLIFLFFYFFCFVFFFFFLVQGTL